MSKTQAAVKIEEESVQTPAEQALTMKVDVKIGSIRSEGNIRAYASINLNDCFAIRNVRVVGSSKGLFVAMPSCRAGNEYKDICFPVTKEFREQLNNAVIDAYHQTLTQSQLQWGTPVHSEQAPEQDAGMQMAEM